MDLIRVQLNKNIAKSTNSGHKSIGNFALITAVFTYLEIALPNLSAGLF